MEIPEKDLPGWYKGGQYDAILLHSGYDRESAYCLMDFIRRVVDSTDDPSYPRICLLDSTAALSKDFQCINRLVEKSTYKFLLVTDNFLEDPFCEMLQNELIMTTLCNADERGRVIPVYPKRPTKRIPIGIRALNALSLSRLIFSGSMTSTLPILTKDNASQLDRYFVPNLQKLFDCNKHERLKREEGDARKLEVWLEAKNEDE